MHSTIVTDHVTSIGLASEDEARSFGGFRASMLYSTGRSTVRPVFSEEEIERNVQGVKPMCSSLELSSLDPQQWKCSS